MSKFRLNNKLKNPSGATVFAVDCDNCLASGHIERFDIDADIKIERNTVPLIEFIKNHVDLVIGFSARINKFWDTINAKNAAKASPHMQRGGLFHEMLPEFLQTCIDPGEGELPHIAFPLMEKEFEQQRWNTVNNRLTEQMPWIDKQKICLCYNLMLVLSATNPSLPINLVIADDRLDILDTLHRFFSLYEAIIPRNITLTLRVRDLCSSHLARYSLNKQWHQSKKKYHLSLSSREKRFQATKHWQEYAYQFVNAFRAGRVQHDEYTWGNFNHNIGLASQARRIPYLEPTPYLLTSGLLRKNNFGRLLNNWLESIRSNVIEIYQEYMQASVGIIDEQLPGRVAAPPLNECTPLTETVATPTAHCCPWCW